MTLRQCQPNWLHLQHPHLPQCDYGLWEPHSVLRHGWGGDRDGWGTALQLLSLIHAGICWDAAHAHHVLCYWSTEDLALLHDLPLQVQHCVLTSASLWVHANHVPILHATLSSKKPSWGHYPCTLHMLLSTAHRCLNKWRTTQEVLPPF